jgi:hypothetical protein
MKFNNTTSLTVKNYGQSVSPGYTNIKEKKNMMLEKIINS